MKRHPYLLAGLLLYLLLISVLMQFDWVKMVRPIPLFSVLLGVLILTLAQYKKGMTKDEVMAHAQWNAFLAGLMTSLLSLLSAFSSYGADTIAIHRLADELVPLIYGSIIYLIIRLFNPEQIGRTTRSASTDAPAENIDIMIDNSGKHSLKALPDLMTINTILSERGFSPRECHVALKLVEGISNKEIAEQLFISEATVKKHIQNMFRKCGVNDRREFMIEFARWMKE